MVNMVNSIKQFVIQIIKHESLDWQGTSFAIRYEYVYDKLDISL